MCGKMRQNFEHLIADKTRSCRGPRNLTQGQWRKLSNSVGCEAQGGATKPEGILCARDRKIYFQGLVPDL